MNLQICKICNKEMPYKAFSISNKTKSGHLCTCKKCRGAYVNTPDTVVCKVCNQELPWYEFKAAANSDNGVSWACCNCLENKPKNISKSRYRQMFDSSYHEKVLKAKRKEMRKNHIKYILNRTKRRAILKGLEFNLSEEDIIIPEICPILEVPIIVGTKDDYEYSPSIDRIDNTKGYIKGNIRIISKKANSMKNSATFQEL